MSIAPDQTDNALPSMEFDEDFLDTLCLEINSTNDPFSLFQSKRDRSPPNTKHSPETQHAQSCYQPPAKFIKGALVSPDDEKSTEDEKIPANDDKTSVRIHRIACKARGMPDSHNPQTAYLEIPENCEHGTTLVCSHPQCAQSGRRFRYCSVCQEPVAKRNFMKRHSHSMVSSRPSFREQSIATEEGLNQTNDQLSNDEKAWLQLLRDRPTLTDRASMSEWMNQVLNQVFSPVATKKDTAKIKETTKIRDTATRRTDTVDVPTTKG